MPRGQRTFWPDNKEDRHAYYVSSRPTRFIRSVDHNLLLYSVTPEFSRRSFSYSTLFVWNDCRLPPDFSKILISSSGA